MPISPTPPSGTNTSSSPAHRRLLSDTFRHQALSRGAAASQGHVAKSPRVAPLTRDGLEITNAPLRVRGIGKRALNHFSGRWFHRHPSLPRRTGASQATPERTLGETLYRSPRRPEPIVHGFAHSCPAPGSGGDVEQPCTRQDRWRRGRRSAMGCQARSMPMPMTANDRIRVRRRSQGPLPTRGREIAAQLEWARSFQQGCRRTWPVRSARHWAI